MINSNINPKNKVDAFVELYEGSTLALTCTCADALQDFTITRAGESKFFGFAIAQTLKLNLIDFERNINIGKGYSAKVGYTANGITVFPYPTFYIDEVTRNEEDNTIEVVAFDALYNADKFTYADLNLSDGYTLVGVATSCANALGCSLTAKDVAITAFTSLSYDDGANLEGTETVKEIIKAIAEATQTIAYIGAGEVLTFRRLIKSDTLHTYADSNNYYELKTGTTFTFGGIVNTTELGDNVEYITNSEGLKQYIRDNPFLELREDVGEIIEDAATALDGLSMTNFSCEWVGNCLLEIGDRIVFITDDDIVRAYNLNSTIVFDGIYNETTEWEYKEDAAESENNPTSLGEALNKTFARVDKANKQIELLASEASANGDRVTALEINLEGIRGTVSKTEQGLNEAVEGLNGSIKELQTQITQTAEQVTITVKEEIKAESEENGITTAKGFTFNNDGLTIEEEGNGIKTRIDIDGMTVYQDANEVLTANSEGVSAVDLHARTFLIIGESSRFEDYNKGGEKRTGCFWIGG